MRDEKEISSQIESNADKLFGKDWLSKLIYSAGYMDGIAYADNHPNWEEIVGRMQKEITNDLRNDRWISVEDELPPKWQWVLCFTKSDGEINTLRYDIYDWKGICFTVSLDDVTHWMPLPQAPHHFAGVSQKVKKGGVR